MERQCTEYRHLARCFFRHVARGGSVSEFSDYIKARACSDKKTIVLPEGKDSRIQEAAREVIKEGIADLIILGNPNEINVRGATIIDPMTSEKREEYAAKFAELRASKGVLLEDARAQMMDENYFGTMMVYMGEADGLVSGACHYTADTLRPALQIIKTAPGTKLVSGWMILCVPDCELGENGTFVFADIGLNEYPDAEALSEIAISSADSWRAFMGTEPHIAMLSYSTKGSAKGEHVEKIREATALVNEKAPKLHCDGEMQLDAALSVRVGASKAPGSSVAGHANVLVFPNLDAGNIGYKLVQRLAKAEAYGPLLQGLAKPVNDLSRGCFASDIVGVIAITAVQAQFQAARDAEAAKA